MKFIKLWILPILISTGVFFAVRPIMAQQLNLQSTLKDFLSSANVYVGTEVKDGYSHVYYIYQNEKVFLTEGGTNFTQADSSGEYIAFIGYINEVGQVFLHHIPSGTTTKLTSSGVNLRPQVSSDGKVVWEGWVKDRWQIFLFDGTKVSQVTHGDLATNPDIEGEFVTFARRDISGTWRAQVYSIAGEKIVDVRTGIGTKKPKLSQGEIILLDEESGVADGFALNAGDLFTLNLEPLVSDELQSLTEEDILKEIQQSTETDEPKNSTSSANSNTDL